MFGLRLLLREPAGHDDVVAEAAEPAPVPGDALRKIGKDNRIRARVVGLAGMRTDTVCGISTKVVQSFGRRANLQGSRIRSQPTIFRRWTRGSDFASAAIRQGSTDALGEDAEEVVSKRPQRRARKEPI